MAVGFSGELTQPFCAWSGRATAKSRAEPISRSEDFFISVLKSHVTYRRIESQWKAVMKFR
jgi:hypothetical protein